MTVSVYAIDAEDRGGTEGWTVRAFDTGGAERAREWTEDRDTADDIVIEMARESAFTSRAGQTPRPRQER